MSVEELQLGPAPEDPRIVLHPHLTVVSGLGADERAELVDTLRRAASGTHPEARMHYRDALDRPLVIRLGTGGTEVEATRPEEAGAHLLPTVTEADLPRVVVLHAEDLGLVPRPPVPLAHPDLDEARDRLERLERALAEAERQAAARADQAAALAEVDDELAELARQAPRRAYARARAALDAVRTEATAAVATLAEMDHDAALVAAGPRLAQAAQEWHEAVAEAEALDAELTGAPVLSPTERAEAMHAPDEVPPAVLAALDDVVRLGDRAAELAAEIAALDAQGPQPPADPVVALLAHQDQELLWATHANALAATETLERAQLAVGGLGASAGAALLVQALEDAHDGVRDSRERAKRQLMAGAAVAAIAAVGSISRVGSVPVPAGLVLVAALALIAVVCVFPRRVVRRAEQAEAHALANVSASSYHGFQLRRVEINDPPTRRRLTRATGDHQAALAAWGEVAGATTLVEAATREGDIRRHADELARSRASVQALASARRTLAEHVGPALEDRRRALAAHCGAPLEADPVDAVARLRQRVDRGRLARAELRRDHTRGRADEAAHLLGAALDAMGEQGGDSPAVRLAGAWEAHDAAQRRMAARAAARPAATVAAELADREADELAARCEGWQDVGPDEAVEPDTAPLEAARARLAAALAAARAAATDPADLARQRAAAASHLDAVVARLTPPTPEVDVDPDRIRARLLDRLAEAATPHPGGTLGILDEAFAHVPVRSTWDLLDLLERVSTRVQLVYLTDSPYVTAWGRRRAPAGAAALLDVGPAA